MQTILTQVVFSRRNMQSPPSLASQTLARQDRDEQEHFENVCEAYRQYATFAVLQWKNQQYRLDTLPEVQKRVLPAGLRRESEENKRRAKDFHDAAIRNQFCLDCILRHAGQAHSQESQASNACRGAVSDGQISKVSSVLKSLARDWSEDGKAERDMAYGPILQSVQEYVPTRADKGKPPRICVPGAGVGRLALELVKKGYAVQGNEFSLHMLLASDFILNGQMCTPSRPMAISPWLLESRNVHTPDDPVRKIMIPDTNPADILSNGPTEPDFSMAAGDFASIYTEPSQRGAWDAVVCCFFLDAAPSIVHYIQIVYDMLKEGGVFISFGPLLYHWSAPTMRPDDQSYEAYQARFNYLDKRYMTSVDFSWQDVREILVNVGFKIEEEQAGMESRYTADVKSMMSMSYRCIHLVARKKAATKSDDVEMKEESLVDGNKSANTS